MINATAQSYIDKIEETCKRIKPKVVINCATYNQENYIRDALEGFIMQKTDFPFVAIVHDDASTDDTADIVREYAEKYPDIILPVFEKENKYSKNDGSLGKIMKTAIKATKALYVALCEGDDYWIDPSKLKTQVDFLDTHLDYSMCFHAVMIKNESVTELVKDFDKIESRDYSAEEIFNQWTIPTCSAMLRMNSYLKRPSNPNFCVGDNVLWATCISSGKVYGLDNLMAVYRRNPGGWTHNAVIDRAHNIQYNKKMCYHWEAMKIEFPMIPSDIFDKEILKNLVVVTINDIKTHNTNLKSYFFHYLKIYNLSYIKSLFSYIFKAIQIQLRDVKNKSMRIYEK